MIAALREAWIWLLLAFFLGLLVGWFLRRVTATSGAAEDQSSRIASLETELADCRSASAKAAAAKPVALAAAPAAKPAAKKPAAAAAPLDLKEARAIIGRPVKLDDLTVVEGIGPKIAGLLKADGISTWSELSKATKARLNKILDDAGPRYNIHDPGTWPKQAGLLAVGKWKEFADLTEKLDGGR